MVRLLLQHGADIETINRAFLDASKNAQWETMDLLPKHKIQQQSIDEAFMRAASTAAVDILHSLAALISDKTKIASRALSTLAKKYKGAKYDPAVSVTAELLLSLGADVNATRAAALESI